MNKRKSFEECAIKTAKLWAERSEDIHKKVGCAILNRDGRLLSIGYNGLKPKQKTQSRFWSNRDKRRSKIIHAEINALSCITRYDNPYLLATTLSPCASCAVNIASYGIKKVLYLEKYENDIEAFNIFKFFNIEIIKFKE